MAGKSRPSAEKRRIDKMRQERQAAKRERRHSRDDGDSAEDSDAPSTEELMERFRVLSEAHAAGKVSDEEFGPARHELMVALGVEDPVEAPAEDSEG